MPKLERGPPRPLSDAERSLDRAVAAWREPGIDGWTDAGDPWFHANGSATGWHRRSVPTGTRWFANSTFRPTPTRYAPSWTGTGATPTGT